MFTTDGTFFVPSGVTTVWVSMAGGCGGGGGDAGECGVYCDGVPGNGAPGRVIVYW